MKPCVNHHNAGKSLGNNLRIKIVKYVDTHIWAASNAKFSLPLLENCNFLFSGKIQTKQNTNFNAFESSRRFLQRKIQESLRNLDGASKKTYGAFLSLKAPEENPSHIQKKTPKETEKILNNEKSQTLNSNTQKFKSKLTNANVNPVLIVLGLHSMPKAL